MYIENKKFIKSKVSLNEIAEEHGYLYFIGDDNCMFVILELYLDYKLSYNALKVNIPRERAAGSITDRSFCRIEVDNTLLNEIKKPNYTFMTSSLIVPQYLNLFDKSIKNINSTIELDEGRAYFVSQLFHELTQMECTTLDTINLINHSPLFVKRNIESPIKNTVNHMINTIREDQNLASTWYCSII